MFEYKKGMFIKTTYGKIGLLVNDPDEELAKNSEWEVRILFTNGEELNQFDIMPDDIADIKNTILDLINLGDYVNGKEVVKIQFNDFSLRELVLSNGEVIKFDSQISNILTLEQFNRNNISEEFINKVDEFKEEYRSFLESEINIR